MAIDLEAIRKRLAEMTGQSKNSRVQLWKPTPGKHKFRGLPWKSTVDGMPFRELRFYYLGEAPRILAPVQFGKPDPVNDLIRKCYQSGKPEDRILAKKLHSKATSYMAGIDRAHEEKGVQVWSFNPFLCQRLLGFFLNEDIGDILDPNEGFDLDVEITPSKKMFNGKPVMDTTVDAARRPTKLSQDPELAKRWLDGVPNIEDLYPQKSTSEIEQILNAWLSGGEASEQGADEGSGRGAPRPKDALDQLVDEVRPAETKQVAPKADKPADRPRKFAKTDLDEPAEPVAKQSLEDAFKELMQDNDS